MSNQQKKTRNNSSDSDSNAISVARCRPAKIRKFVWPLTEKWPYTRIRDINLRSLCTRVDVKILRVRVSFARDSDSCFFRFPSGISEPSDLSNLLPIRLLQPLNGQSICEGSAHTVSRSDVWKIMIAMWNVCCRRNVYALCCAFVEYHSLLFLLFFKTPNDKNSYERRCTVIRAAFVIFMTGDVFKTSSLL